MTDINYIKRDNKIPNLKISYFADTCFDIRAYTPNNNIIINHLEWTKINTGIMIDIPLGIDTQIRPRSGLAEEFGITILNSPGTIDAGYKGEIQILLINFGKKPYTIKNGDKIAQICFSRKKQVNLIPRKPTIEEIKDLQIIHDKTPKDPSPIDELPKNIIRHNKGFGSSGNI